jgi:hypothetical protein
VLACYGGIQTSNGGGREDAGGRRQRFLKFLTGLCRLSIQNFGRFPEHLGLRIHCWVLGE